MARTASIALGGYYPTPHSTIPLIASHLACPINGYKRVALLDPCAGKGEAVLALADLLTSDLHDASYQVHAAEMETERAAELERAVKNSNASGASTTLCTDAFQIVWTFDRWNNGADLLFLNPPYDHDREHGRLEEKFLDRFTAALRPGGILVFLVPFHALKASAATLARDYHSIACYRFPEPEWDTFKQVVLFAVRSDTADPTLAEQSRIEAWASDPAIIPVLTHADDPTYIISSDSGSGFDKFEALQIDLQATMREALPGIGQRWLGLDTTPENLTDIVFPVAQPPSAAHISQALASGVMAGQRVSPDTDGLPELLVNGTFERWFDTIDTREDDKGQTVGYIQVQKPKLRVSVLDLETYEYHDLAQGAEPTGATTLAAFNIADLLQHYQTSLIETLRRQCPALHDPTNPDHHIALPPTARTLYHVQDHAAQTCLKLLRQGDTPFLLGEVGTGKSTISLATALAYGAKRILVFCPPHLTHSWVDQVQAVLPGATARIVEEISDLNIEAEPSDQPGAGIIIYILSQTSGKLGHSLVPGVTAQHTCPRCDSKVGLSNTELVSQRRRCTHRALSATDDLGRFVLDLAQLLSPCTCMKGQGLSKFAPARMLQQAMKEWSIWAPGRLDNLLERLAAIVLERSDLWQALALLIVAHPGNLDEFVERTARELYAREGATSFQFDIARNLLLLLQSTERILELVAELQVLGLERVYSYHNPWNDTRAYAQGTKTNYHSGAKRSVAGFSYEHNQTKYERGDSAAALKAFRFLETHVEWQRGPVCGEPLYQSSAQPRRYPLASYLSRYARHLYDFALLDEGQEYRTEGSAQERAAHRLSEGKPTMILSGSIGNGKASGLFINMWALNRRFRTEFERDQAALFTNIYGYRKQYTEIPENARENITTYGSVTDRTEDFNYTTRKLGEAPGVLPLFILRHLMPVAVWVRKTDLDTELPTYQETSEIITPTSDQREIYDVLERELLGRIAADRFQEGMAGKLFGQLGQLPSVMDRCTTDTGNGHRDTWTINYPPSAGGMHVTSAALLPATSELPKETWLIDKVRGELAEGRNVLIFVQHTGSGLATRLQKVLKSAGIKASYLDAGKVSTKKRETWVNKEISSGCNVLLVNPMAVQTGLNNLVYFSTAIWYEPICDAIAWRQANGRLHRIGQTNEVRVIAAIYARCSQGDVLDLNAMKVRASMALDGLDISAALQASGAGDDDAEAAFELGMALYKRMTDPGYQRIEATLPTRVVPIQPQQPVQASIEPAAFKTVPASATHRRKRAAEPVPAETEPLQFVMFDDLAIDNTRQ